jgi:aspartate/methionine/tyrosine aminotransferase
MEYEKPLFFQLMQYARGADRDVIDMVSGDPDWDPPPGIAAGLREYASLESREFQYPPSEGLFALREAIAAREGVAVENVVVTNGAGEANYLAMAAALGRDAGSEVLLTDPVYPYYPGKVELLGGESTYVPVAADGGLDPEAVRERASGETCLIVANSPNNPTGAVYDRETMAGLLAVAEERDALVLSDEVYSEFDFSGTFASALAIDSDRRVVTNSVSKSMAITGFRVGYGIFPDELVERAKTRHMLLNVAGSRPAQHAVCRALRETDPEYYAANRRMLAERVETFTEELDRAGADVMRPRGGFYVLARFPGFPGTMKNAKRLVDEAGVAGMPGEAFGSARGEWLRFALVTPAVGEAARRLAAFFD